MKSPELKANIELSAKAELRGEASTETTDRGINALIDAVSPFTEGMGLIGDHIRAHRYDVALKIALRAQKIAKERGLRITPPPLKFTVPFLEKASTEQVDNELTELWARLLVDASDEFDGSHLTFIQILSEVSGNEARYLNELAQSYNIDYQLPPTLDMAKEFAKKIAEVLSENPFNTYSANSTEAEVDQVFETIYGIKDINCYRPIKISLPYTDGNCTKRKIQGMHATTAYLLKRQSILEIEAYYALPDRGGVDFEIAGLSPLGESFVVSCLGLG